MGKKQRDCVGCGAPVGFLDRTHCWVCVRRRREDAAKSTCPGCGLRRVLPAGAELCVTCSKRCVGCGNPLRFKGSTMCRACRLVEQRRAARQPCPRCDRLGYLEIPPNREGVRYEE